MTAAKKVKMKFLLAWKLVNWYLVGGGVFLLVRMRMSKFFWLVLNSSLFIPCPNEENPAIWSQFGPKLHNLKSDESLQSARVFFLI